MKCVEINELMMRYFDGEVNDIDIYLFKQHLKNCIACREQYSSLLETVEYIESQPLLDTPEDFEESVMDKINELPLERKDFSRVSINLFFIAASFVFLMMGVLAGIFLHSVTLMDLIGVVLSKGSAMDFLNIVLSAMESSYKTIMIVGNSILDIYYGLFKKYYDVFLSIISISVISYIMSTRMLKHN